MKVSSEEVLLTAIAHYKVQPHSGMTSFIFTHESGTTEGVSMILLLTECENRVRELQAVEQKLRDIARVVYAPLQLPS